MPQELNSPLSSHSSIDQVTERLAMLVNQTAKLDARLNPPRPQQAGKGVEMGKNPESPSLLEKISGVHSLLTSLEVNIGAIGSAIG